MKTKNLLKLLHALFAAVALVVFLAAPFVSFGGKFSLSGARMLENLNDENLWMVLFVIMPVLAACSNFSDSKALRGIASGAMLLPVLILFAQEDSSRLDLEAGGIVYCVASVALIILAVIPAPAEESEAPSIRPAAAGPNTPAPAADTAGSEARSYDAERLQTIVANPALYRNELVESCREELRIREAAAGLMPQTEQMPDEKLSEICNAPQTYSPELLYCAQKTLEARAAAVRERQAREEAERRAQLQKEAEERRARQRQEAEQARLRRQAAWKRWRPFAGLALLLALAGAVAAYLTSDGHRYARAVKLAGNQEQALKAAKLLEKIEDPEFEHYAAAKGLLCDCYLSLQDSAAAARALTDAVSQQDWSAPETYDRYVHFRRTGELAPHLPQSVRLAAECLALAPDAERKLEAGILFFGSGIYGSAGEAFESVEFVPKAKGYLGILHLYGLGMEQNFETAYDYLRQAPREMPFVVHLGDLTLYLRKGKGYGVMSHIEAADELYAEAARLAPDDKACTDRHTVTRNVLDAQKKHARTSYWDRGSVYWNSYTFDKGSYTGEYTEWNGSGGAHGWGCFTWKQSKEIRLAKYAHLVSAGLGINITDNYRITVGTLNGNYGQLVSGTLITPQGVTKTGVFKNSELVEGSEYNPNGTLLSRVK